MPTLNERWWAHQEAENEGRFENESAGAEFAVRGDGALVIFDEWGWFAIVSTGPGPNPGAPSERVENVLKLEAPDGTQEDVYIEPIWVTGYYESIAQGVFGKW